MARIGKRIESVSERTMEQLLEYRWPGNIRELENVLERAVILETDSVLEIAPGILSAPGAVSPASERPSLETVERDHISSVLRETNWVVEGPRGAAKILGLHPNTLRNRLKKLGIERAATARGSRHHLSAGRSPVPLSPAAFDFRFAGSRCASRTGRAGQRNTTRIASRCNRRRRVWLPNTVGQNGATGWNGHPRHHSALS